MLSREFITEMSVVSPELKKALLKQGYQFLGKGIDMQAFLEPKTGLVMKVFGYSVLGNSGVMSRSQKTFKAFADYCMKHPDNPFLPNFLGWEKFKYEGDMYLKIRMERLFPMSKVGWGNCLEAIAEAAEYNGTEKGKQTFLSDYAPKDSYHKWPESKMPEVLSHLGDEGFNVLWNTIVDLNRLAGRIRSTLDLHGKNFMLGSDGHIVISDPFYIP